MGKKAAKGSKGKSKSAAYDLIWGDDLQTNLDAASSFLWQKGFCVIKPTIGDAVVKAASDEVRQLDMDSKIQPPPLEIVDGLLGADGSSKLYEVPLGDESGLQKLDKAIMNLGLDYTAAAVGLTVQSKSQALLHITSEPEEDEDRPALTDAEARGYLSVFMKTKLMLVYFMGQYDGTLELSLFNVEDTAPFTVSTEPGMLVLLRADMMSHRHYSNNETKALSFFYMQESKDCISDAGSTATPTIDLLSKWVMHRLRQIKDDEAVVEAGAVETAGVPKDWISSMNKYFAVGPQTAIRSAAARFPSTWKAENVWFGMLTGCDFVEEIPPFRWDLELGYDPAEDSWKNFKSCAKHMSVVDGLELFDPKFFALSPAEVRSMDPQQRQALEIAYEALNRAGNTKKMLMKSLVGVYLGASVASEWADAPKGGDTSGAATTGGAASIASNRISFCLGLQGPSYTVDLGNAASLCAVTHGYNSQRYQTKGYSPCWLAISGAQYVAFSQRICVIQCTQGLLSPVGRCFTFDSGASGYAKGEGFGFITMQKYGAEVDGQIVEDEKEKLGTINSAVISHQGYMAHYLTPSGPGFQDLITSCLRQAQLQPYDIDAIDISAGGRLLDDAVETMASNNSLRFEDPESAPLVVSSAKTNFGLQQECSGVAQLLKNIYSQTAGVNLPTQHLTQLNPHIEGDTELSLIIGAEMTATKGVGSFMATTNFAHGGTMAQVITSGFKNESKLLGPEGKPVAPASLQFWPGGGGKLEEKLKPLEGYMIIGSWTSFNKPEPMIKESKDAYVFTVTLGVNGFEHFQIWLDGDSDKALHPATVLGAAYTPLSGPVHADCCKGLNWLVGQAEGASPGDQYLVRLQLAGKWRSVGWEKVGAIKAPPTDNGTYFVVGNWNNWGAQEMSSTGPGFCFAELVIPKTTKAARFQIIRDGDCSQTFYPEGADVAGPADPPSLSCAWEFSAKAGDTYRITLKREGSKAEVKYEKVAEGAKFTSEPFKPEFGVSCLNSSPKQYFKMESKSQFVYSTYVKIIGDITFQILMNGDNRQAYYPDKQGATTNYKAKILGPDVSQGDGRGWLLKRDLTDTSEEGGTYEITVSVNSLDMRPEMVTWSCVS